MSLSYYVVVVDDGTHNVAFDFVPGSSTWKKPWQGRSYKKSELTQAIQNSTFFVLYHLLVMTCTYLIQVQILTAHNFVGQ